MSLYEDLISKKTKLSLVGLGYVGMPIAVAFAKKIDVIGYDLNAKKIELYKRGIDPTKEVGDDAIKATTVDFTADESKLCEAKFHIVAVPTPVDDFPRAGYSTDRSMHGSTYCARSPSSSAYAAFPWGFSFCRFCLSKPYHKKSAIAITKTHDFIGRPLPLCRQRGLWRTFLLPFHVAARLPQSSSLQRRPHCEHL